MSDEEETISLSEGESEGEGPNIRPPQPAGQSKHKHKKSKKSKDWKNNDRRDIDKRQHRERKKSERNDRDRRVDRDRHRIRDRDIRRDRSDDHGGDLRHKISRERYDRGGQHRSYSRDGERTRYDRERTDETAEERDRRIEHEDRMNRIIRSNKYMEESRKEVEARKKTKELEKEMKRLTAVLKRKKAARNSRSRSRDRKKKRRKKSESTEESGQESEGDEAVKGSGSEQEAEDDEDGSDESEEESGDESESEAGSDDTTGSQKSEETPEHEESSDEGEVEDEEDEKKMEVVASKKVEEAPEEEEEKEEVEKMQIEEKSPPIGGKWAEQSPDRTPSRSPTPLKEVSGNDSDRSPRRKNDSGGSRSHSPSGSQHLESPPLSPVPLKDELPPFLPSVHGCRSVAEFKCLNRIEEGTYGVVYRARDKRTQEIVALKRLKMEREKEGFPITSLREINTLLISQHPNVVTVREIVVGSNMDQIFIVMDFVHHDLKGLMETMRKKNQVFLCGEIKCLMIQLLRAINHLHDNWILHRDLKASNLLLSHNGILKVGDFGLAREYGSPLKAYTSVVVTLWYRAPELLLGIKEYSTFIDVWSIGCIFGELLLMEPLFPGKSEVDELNRIFKLLGTPSEKVWPGYKELPGVQKMKFVDHPISHLRDKFPEKMLSEKGLSLLKSLLTYDPKNRASCESAMRAEYFREDPRPIDPSMFPTWPAKSEQEPGDKVKKVSSPKAPSGGMAFKNMEDDDEARARGLSKKMVVKFSDEDIKKHLTDLGYKNIPEEKLKTFVADLRRLMKYEEKKKLLDNKLENLENLEPCSRSKPRNEEIKTKGQDGEEIRIKSQDGETRTRKKRRRSELTEIKTKVSMTEESSRLTSSSSEFSRQTTSSSSNLSGVRAEESSLYVDVLIPRFNSEKSLPLAASLLERPGSGVIRCRSTQGLQGPTGRRGRTDPVNLHQEYKKVWDKLNLPGETSHNKLRWAVRGWMMGEEPK